MLFLAGYALAILIAFLIAREARKKFAPLFTSSNPLDQYGGINIGRFSPKTRNKLTIFIIGMRINTWYRVDLWFQVLCGMSFMLRELQSDPSKYGFLGNETYGIAALLFGYPSIQVTYWDNSELLQQFATDLTHSTAMKNFSKIVDKTKGEVGIYHELYEVLRYEGVHRNMNDFGLVEAIGSVPSSGEYATARSRLNVSQRAAAVESNK